MHPELVLALEKAGLSDVFSDLSYSKRKEFARQVAEPKADATRKRRIEKVIENVGAERVAKT
jgi:uncharacterized protein YdeI (YjbR/CyaY-like superfamily)